jgi:hypothetical protein
VKQVQVVGFGGVAGLRDGEVGIDEIRAAYP